MADRVPTMTTARIKAMKLQPEIRFRFLVSRCVEVIRQIDKRQAELTDAVATMEHMMNNDGNVPEGKI